MFCVQVKVSIAQKSEQTLKYKTLIGLNNITLDACALGGGSMTHTLFEMFSTQLKENGNVVQPCPWSVSWEGDDFFEYNNFPILFKGRLYLKDMPVNGFTVLPVLPYGDLFNAILYSPVNRNLDHIIIDIKILAEIKAP